MNRQEFMNQLERLLSDVPEAERQDALAYYEDYFDEAGPEQEAQVIQDLGSPGRVAATIKADLKDGGRNRENLRRTVIRTPDSGNRARHRPGERTVQRKPGKKSSGRISGSSTGKNDGSSASPEESADGRF